MELHMNPFKGRHFSVTSFCGPYAGTANTASVTVSCRRCWLNAEWMSITPRFTAGFSVMRLKWKNGCAGTGVTLPIFARGTWMKPTWRSMAAGRICSRAVDSRGRTVDFYLSSRRNSKPAYRFLGKSSTTWRSGIPRFINTDKAPAYGRALALLKREGRCPSDVEHRQIKYRNNVIECDHGKLKRIIGATLGFNPWRRLTPPSKVLRWCVHYAKAVPQHFIMVIPGRNAPGKQSFWNVRPLNETKGCLIANFATALACAIWISGLHWCHAGARHETRSLPGSIVCWIMAIFPAVYDADAAQVLITLQPSYRSDWY